MRHQRTSFQGADNEFVQFVLASQPQLLRLAYLVCGDWHRAEDIVQTALTKLYVRWSHVRRDEGAQPYVRRTVVNAAIDERRRPWRREHPVPELPEMPQEDSQSMDAAVIDALMSLAAKQRAVIVLRYIEDLDVAQTADILGISPGTIKSQAAKALATLRKRLPFPAVALIKGEEQ